MKNNTWTEAKKRCRLSQADIQMAKELGMKPKSLMKNIPSSKQQWKEPVNIWIRNLYEKRFGTVLQPEIKNVKQKNEASRQGKYFTDEELPF